MKVTVTRYTDDGVVVYDMDTDFVSEELHGDLESLLKATLKMTAAELAEDDAS